MPSREVPKTRLRVRQPPVILAAVGAVESHEYCAGDSLVAQLAADLGAGRFLSRRSKRLGPVGRAAQRTNAHYETIDEQVTRRRKPAAELLEDVITLAPGLALLSRLSSASRIWAVARVVGTLVVG